MSYLNCFAMTEELKLTPKQANYEYTLTRGYPTAGTSCLFDADLYSVKFKVNENILLTGLSFFGPAEVEKCLYMIYIEVREMKNKKVSKLLMKDYWDIVEAQKGYISRINFTDPICFSKNVLYDIRFEVKGHSTQYCTDIRSSISVGTYKDVVKFKFYENSRQMAEMYFKLG